MICSSAIRTGAASARSGPGPASPPARPHTRCARARSASGPCLPRLAKRKARFAISPTGRARRRLSTPLPCNPSARGSAAKRSPPCGPHIRSRPELFSVFLDDGLERLVIAQLLIRAEVRRSMKRWVSFSCSASDSGPRRRACALPMARIGEPARPVRGMGPGADMGKARLDRIDLASALSKARDLGSQPIRVDDALAARQLLENLLRQARVLVPPSLSGSQEAGRPPHRSRTLSAEPPALRCRRPLSASAE